MIVYRLVNDDDLKVIVGGGQLDPVKLSFPKSNTFSYEEEVEYIHFFLFAECAQLWNELKFGKRKQLEMNIAQFDIPDEILRQGLEYGYLPSIIPGYYTPVPEFAIPLKSFRNQYFVDASKTPKEEWLQEEEFKRYLSLININMLWNAETDNFNEGYDRYSILNIEYDPFKKETEYKPKPKS